MDEGTFELKFDWKDLNRALKSIDAGLAKDMRTWLVNALNASGVVQDAKGVFPKESGRAAATIRAMPTRQGAAVKAGGKRAPYVGWVDYGGKVTQRSNPRHVAVRPFVREGRYIRPRVMARREEAIRQLERETAEFLSRI